VDVLLVDDDVRLAAALVTQLRRLGHTVTHVTTGAEALAARRPDIVLLDIGLPDRDGLSVCRALRRNGSDVGIIMLTARGEEHDRVAGLRGGADDYLVKPFSLAELAARVEAVGRRLGRRSTGPVVVGPLVVDRDRHEATVDGTRLDLTRTEFQLLAALASRAGTVVPRDQLIVEVWQTSWAGASRTLDTHLANLRAKLGDAVDVSTVRGVGFRLG
jgi:DNA-binding response OmpR family regulator